MKILPRLNAKCAENESKVMLVIGYVVGNWLHESSTHSKQRHIQTVIYELRIAHQAWILVTLKQMVSSKLTVKLATQYSVMCSG
jgi:hypothetical protein